MFTLTMTGDRAVNAYLAGIPGRLHTEIQTAIRNLGRRLFEEVDRNLSGRVLQQRSGKLRSMTQLTINSSPQQTTATVSNSAPYARINEYGGTTPPHVIMPASARALAFPWQGGTGFFKKINHPGSKIPERSFLRSALASMKDEIRTELERAVARATEPR